MPAGPFGCADGAALAGLAEAVAAAAGCDAELPAVALVLALAMVRPRARVAPSAPAPMAVPMSGRGILTWCSFRRLAPGRARYQGLAGLACWVPVGPAELAAIWGPPLSLR